MASSNPAAARRSHNPLDSAEIVGRGRWSADLGNSVLLIDKSCGPVSSDVLREIRQLAGTRRVGHAGTLDPMATGLLIVMTGTCTRLARHFLEMEKEYTGTLRLGARTASLDAGTPVEQSEDASHVTLVDVKAAAARLTGTLIQTTPAYSAVRVKGKRLYRRARQGDVRSGPPRVVDVSVFEITDKRGTDVDFRVVCSKGTYVRALAADLGDSLNVGAHLIALRRVRIGEYRVADAATVDEVRRRFKPTVRHGRRGAP